MHALGITEIVYQPGSRIEKKGSSVLPPLIGAHQS
jgi:hypothetical protein